MPAARASVAGAERRGDVARAATLALDAATAAWKEYAEADASEMLAAVFRLAEMKDSPLPVQSRDALCGGAFLLQATIDEYKGRYDDALAAAAEALKRFHAPDDKKKIIEAVNRRAEILRLQSKYLEAESEARAALALAQEIGDNAGEAAAVNIIGLRYFFYDALDDALRWFERSLAICKSLGAQGSVARLLNNIAIVHSRRSDYDEMLKYSLSGLQTAEAAGDRLLIAEFLNKIGLVHKHRGEHDKALDYFHRSLDVAQSIGNQDAVGTALANIATVYHTFGEYGEALEYFKRALPIFETTNNGVFLANTLNNIGVLQRNIGEYNEALEYHKRSLAIRRSIGTPSNIAASLSEIGSDYDSLGAYPDALKYYTESLEALESIDDRSGIAHTLSHIGDLHFNHGVYAMALDQYKRSLEIREAIGDRDAIVNSLAGVAQAHFKCGNAQESFAAANRALAMADKSKMKKKLYELHDLLFQSFESTGDAAAALLHHKEYVKYKEEVFKEESMKKLRNLQVQLGLERSKRETESQRQRADKLESDLANSAVSLAAQTELLAKFRDELRHIVREVDEPIDALKRIKEKLKTLPCEQVDWSKFEKEFAEVHPEFKAELLEKFPDLTKQEVKMCQFARLGLKTHQMAQLLCLSERNIENHRYRLRKKLRLKTGENLTGFLELLR